MRARLFAFARSTSNRAATSQPIHQNNTQTSADSPLLNLNSEATLAFKVIISLHSPPQSSVPSLVFTPDTCPCLYSLSLGHDVTKLTHNKHDKLQTCFDMPNVPGLFNMFPTLTYYIFLLILVLPGLWLTIKKKELPGFTLGIGANVAIAISYSVTFVRIYIRLKFKTFGLDDYLIIGATVLCLGFHYLIIFTVRTGCYDKEVTRTYSYAEMEYAGWFVFITELIYPIAASSIRCSICTFFIRLSTLRWQRRLTWGIIILVILTMVLATLFSALTYDTIVGIFIQKHNDKPDTPIRRNSSYYLRLAILISTSIAAVADLAIVAIPYFILGRVNKSWQWRACVIGVLSLSGAGCVANFTRLAFMPLAGEHMGRLAIGICTVVELLYAVVVASLVALKPLMERWWPDSAHTVGMDFPLVPVGVTPPEEMPAAVMRREEPRVEGSDRGGEEARQARREASRNERREASRNERREASRNERGEERRLERLAQEEDPDAILPIRD
ncbi:hypothetical protein CC80DRAFT_511469 [Byssothecium circinans]|uniref:Rhodopsin domain-containing protein n=1 Tax=Byssothecium circinans TaxID=147558 RepID=A0A6A5T7L1_9PLEO|nr:hypothetical protein CC80DRAFT_599840 [Byssothecium circinans]KAF1948293.1 hypothetical protein CC80DRAFT_511469 [Byssothecium circinans]